MSDQLPAVLQYLALGWQPVAAPVKGKTPIRSWKRQQTERVTEREVREGFARPANIFLITGSVSRLAVIDCDDEDALKYWRAKLGSILDKTTAVQTGRGWHFYFRLPKGAKPRGQSSPGGGTGVGGWHIRAEGGGVIAPPSVHESGRVYSWAPDRGPDALQEAPSDLFDKDAEESDSGSPRSILTHLLEHPPSEGGRNSWLAQVAGHYARHLPYQDAYEHLVREAADKLAPPLPDEEIDKLIPSIWRAEQAKEGRAAPDIDEDGEDAWRAGLLKPAEGTGWLVSGDTRILVQTRFKNHDGEWEMGLATWMDCDVRVLGIVSGELDQVYGVELRFPDGDVVEDHLPAKTIADSRALGGWLASHGASIGPPDVMWPVKMRESTRLLRYLRAQGADEMVAADALGWHKESEAFVTHEGIIRSSGPSRFENVRPDPSIKGWAPYRYGHAGRSEAAAILSEILTYHDREVAAVFGAWWAACLLKPQIQEVTSQFPFMALEASSESGKTTGFFPLMMQLSGNHSGQSNPTRAALRDYLSAHHNGIVWVDDLDSLDSLGELLRNVTVGGSMVKKGEGNHSQVVAQMRGALVVSGESLGLHDQKALVDRAILLDVPSPVGRKSLRGDYPQWDDIVALRERHPDLTDHAGSIVEMALGAAPLVGDLKALRIGSGRHADALATVRTGARLLRSILSDYPYDWIVELADQWAERAAANYSGKENVLTLKLIPLALERTGWLTKPDGPNPASRQVATPAFIEAEDTVWFSPKLLAAWWEREPPVNKKVNARVESAVALEQQARELGLGGKKGRGRKDFRLATGDGTQRYWMCTPELSEVLISRSRGQGDGGADGKQSRIVF